MVCLPQPQTQFRITESNNLPVPADAVPLRQMKLNKVPFVPNDEPLLGILDKFQDGRSHMAIVSRFSAARAKSVKKAVKQSLTQRIRQTVGISDDSGSSSESEDSGDETGSIESRTTRSKLRNSTFSDSPIDPVPTLRGNPISEEDQDGDHSAGGTSEPGVTKRRRFRLRRKKDEKRRRKARREEAKQGDIEMGEIPRGAENGRSGGFGLSSKEQITPADAVLAKESVNEVRFFLL